MRPPRSTLRSLRRRAARLRWVRFILLRRDRLRRAHDAAALVPGPFALYEAMLPDRPARTIVVLTHRSLRDSLGPWLRQFPNDHRHVVSAEAAPEWQLEGGGVVHHPAASASGMGWAIKLIGPVDVLINLLPEELLPDDVPHHQEMWRRLYFHLNPEGLYILDRSSPPGSEFGESLGTWMATLAKSNDPEAVPKSPRRDAELFRSTSAAVMSRDMIVLRKRGKHYVKLRDSETNRMVAAREPGITVRELATLPAGESESRAVITSHEASIPIGRLPETMTYPKLYLRHYQGRIAFAGSSLMYGDNSILPDSFRHHLGSALSNARITDVSHLFARIPDSLQPTEVLRGNFYQLDSTFSGHFGHFTTEVLSRFWGWDRAKQAIPDLKVIMRKHPKELQPQFERQFFQAYGIAESDIVWTDRPVYLESVVSASPMWHNETPQYVHPGLRDVWQRLAGSLVDQAGSTPERIFVSRSSQWGRRTCRNAREVEQFFESAGFTVVYPEHLRLGQQAGVFAGAKVIAGFGGSAMFNMMYAEKMTTTILLSHEAYTARNEHLFTSLLGGDVHYFWSVPDVTHPAKGWSKDAFFSDWEFDFERNREPLERLIAVL